MKERENREELDTANDYPSHNAINRYLYIVITGFLRVRQNPDPARTKRSKGRLSPLPGPDKTGYLKKRQDVFMFHKNSCQGEAPGPLERRGGKPWRGHS